jgi:hypothetical protein
MEMNREWLRFLREQFPAGSRIRLREMKDPYNPVEPGTMGTLKAIDDIGTFHVNWDNGRALGVVLGEDSFSVLPDEAHTLKLYMPMAVDAYERDEWGDLESEPTPLSNSEAAKYLHNITAALLRERGAGEAEFGMMTYHDGNDSVKQKVKTYVFSAEVRDGKLWGVAECKVIGELTAGELDTLKDYISGQASDGFGEGFEQREIITPDGEIYAHLWQWENWSVQTESELFTPKLAKGLPELCFSTLPSTGELICIKRGESGYYPSDWDTGDRQRNVELADYNNERLGVTAAQRQAMECGSMHGWGVPSADPKTYELTPQMGGMTLG